jgi:hypothetical protein
MIKFPIHKVRPKLPQVLKFVTCQVTSPTESKHEQRYVQSYTVSHSVGDELRLSGRCVSYVFFFGFDVRSNNVFRVLLSLQATNQVTICTTVLWARCNIIHEFRQNCFFDNPSCGPNDAAIYTKKCYCSISNHVLHRLGF